MYLPKDIAVLPNQKYFLAYLMMNTDKQHDENTEKLY